MTEQIRVECCIAGGGPAGVMLGLLLARAGVRTLVLEKHADFLRDFRGDTVHPSTLEVLYELDILEAFLKRPHQEVQRLQAWIGDKTVRLADFSRLPSHCRFVAMTPQWEFLYFLLQEARRYSAFQFRFQTEVVDLQRETAMPGARVRGLKARSDTGDLEIAADVVIGADGRESIIRRIAGLEVMQFDAPMDVLWMRLERQASDPCDSFGRIARGRMMVLINRGDYWQAAYLIRKGALEDLKQKGLDSFRRELVGLIHFLEGRTGTLTSWEDIKLLTVRVDRLREWYAPGVLCIGDAAHAMSPIGGVGINLAIQDAVAAANILAEPLRRCTTEVAELRAVQHRRQFPTAFTQKLQILAQNKLIERALDPNSPLKVPWLLRLVDRSRLLQGIPGRLIGLGLRPEHVCSADCGY